MKKTMKIRFFLDLEKEERFINSMNKKGWKLELVQFGIFYSFVQSDPEEYFTVMCATEKSKVLQMTSAAVLSGYESIPHTYDGISNILYLSGRKNEVTDVFFNDNQDKLNHYKNVKKIYRYQTLLMSAVSLLYLLPLIVMHKPVIKILKNLNLYCDKHLSSALTPVVFIFIFAALGLGFLIAAFRLLRMYLRTEKQCEALNTDMKLYE